jgi:hypothetical protein
MCSLPGLVYATTDVTYKREMLIYPFISFVAEFGGALGLFLGFSFYTIWEFMAPVLYKFFQIKY